MHPTRQILADLAALEKPNAILILMEAWMPPITDFIVFLRNLRKASARTTIIRICLIGRPVQGNRLHPGRAR